MHRHRVQSQMCLDIVDIYCVDAMGWLRLVGSLKLYVSLENIGLFCGALLQKRPTILRSLLVIATPYVDAYLTLMHTVDATLMHI